MCKNNKFIWCHMQVFFVFWKQSACANKYADNSIQKIKKKGIQNIGSSWTLQVSTKLHMVIFKTKQVKGGYYMQTPETVKNFTWGLFYVINKQDEECLRWRMTHQQTEKSNHDSRVTMLTHLRILMVLLYVLLFLLVFVNLQINNMYVYLFYVVWAKKLRLGLASQAIFIIWHV